MYTDPEGLMIAQCEATNSCPRASEGIRGGGIAGGGAAISGVRAWLCWAAGICNLNEDANSNAPQAETPQICDSDSPTGRTPDPDDDNESTPETDKAKFSNVRGRDAKRNKESGEIWVKDRLHKDHYEVYKNLKDYEKGTRSRSVWSDGRPKGTF